MRMKMGLKKVLRRINESGLIVRNNNNHVNGMNNKNAPWMNTATRPPSQSVPSAAHATPSIQSLGGSGSGGAASGPSSKLGSASGSLAGSGSTSKQLSPEPSPAGGGSDSQQRSSRIEGARSSSVWVPSSSSAPNAMPNAATTGENVNVNGDSLPDSAPLTIRELSQTVSTLDLSGPLASLAGIQDLTQHLSRMSNSGCRFHSAESLLWALKVLTIHSSKERPPENIMKEAMAQVEASMKEHHQLQQQVTQGKEHTTVIERRLLEHEHKIRPREEEEKTSPNSPPSIQATSPISVIGPISSRKRSIIGRLSNASRGAAPRSLASKHPSLQNVLPTRAQFLAKKAWIEHIIAEQKFEANVVQYLRRHALGTNTSTDEKNNNGGSEGKTKKGMATVDEEAQPLSHHLKSALSEPPAQAIKVSNAPNDGHTTTSDAHLHARSATSSPPRLASTGFLRAPGVSGSKDDGTGSNSSSRSNSTQNELESEWRRRRIPRIRQHHPGAGVGAGAGASSSRDANGRPAIDMIRQRIDAKLREEEEEMEEKRRTVVEKMKNMNIWKDPSAITDASILSSLTAHRFDLLRFQWEMTELSEMATPGIGVRFESVAQALGAVRALYARSSSAAESIIATHGLDERARNYIEIRRREIQSARMDFGMENGMGLEVMQPTRHSSASVSSYGYGLGNGHGTMTRASSASVVVPSPSSAARAAAATIGSVAPSQPPTKNATSMLSPRSLASSMPVSTPLPNPIAHHRAISMVELVEVMNSGNLISRTPTSTSISSVADPSTIGHAEYVPFQCTPASLSWLLSDAGVDLAEISIDDLIQLQQHPALVGESGGSGNGSGKGSGGGGFQNAKQLVAALQIIYTDYDEAEVEELCDRECMTPQVKNFLLAHTRSKAASALSPNNSSPDIENGSSSSSPMSSSLVDTLTFAIGGHKRSRLQRAQRAREMRSKIIEIQLAMLEEEAEMKKDEVQVEHGPFSKDPTLERDRMELRMRSRRLNPLPNLAMTKVCETINAAENRSLFSKQATGLPLTEAELAQLVVELPLSLGGSLSASSTEDGAHQSDLDPDQDPCDIDLGDLEAMRRSNTEDASFKTTPIQFTTPKQVLLALQLLNVDCGSMSSLDDCCKRAGFNEGVINYLHQHSFTALAARILNASQNSASAAAQYVVMESEVHKMDSMSSTSWEEYSLEEEEFDELEGAQCDVQYGSGMRSRSKPSSPLFAHRPMHTFDVSMDLDLAQADLVTSRHITPISISALATRLQHSNVLLLPTDGTPIVQPSTLAHLISSASIPIRQLDANMLWEDLANFENQGGIKFRNVRQLLVALSLLQDPNLVGSASGEEELLAECSRQHFSPSVTTFLLQLFRSPARAEALAAHRGGGVGFSSPRSRGSKGLPVARSVLMHTRSSSSDGWAAELVSQDAASASIAKKVCELNLVDLGMDEADQMIVEEEVDDEHASLLASSSKSSTRRTEAELSHLLESHQQLRAVPLHCLQADLAAFSAEELRFSTPQQLVTILELVHSTTEEEEEHERDEVTIEKFQRALDETNSNIPKDQRARYAQFLMRYANTTHEIDQAQRDVIKVKVRKSSSNNNTQSRAQPHIMRRIDEAELEMVEEIVDLSDMDSNVDPVANQSAFRHRLAQVLHQVSCASVLDEEELVEEEVNQLCSELHFEVDVGVLQHLQEMIVEYEEGSLLDAAEAVVHTGPSSSARNRPLPSAKPVIMALQLIHQAEDDELNNAKLDLSELSRKASEQLPPRLASFVLKHIQHAHHLNEKVIERRRDKSNNKTKSTPKVKQVKFSQQEMGDDMRAEEVQQMLVKELECMDLNMDDDEIVIDGSASPTSRQRRHLQSLITQHALHLSTVTLDEVRIIRENASRSGHRPTPKQVIQTLALMQLDMGAHHGSVVSRARMMKELKTMESKFGSHGRGSNLQRHADVVQMCLEAEEQLCEVIEEIPTSRNKSDTNNNNNRSRSQSSIPPPPPPIPGHTLRPTSASVSFSSTSFSSAPGPPPLPPPLGPSRSPLPPPLPTHASTSGRHSSGPPPLPSPLGTQHSSASSLLHQHNRASSGMSEGEDASAAGTPHPDEQGLAPIQETEPPEPQGCCGKSSCTIM